MSSKRLSHFQFIGQTYHQFQITQIFDLHELHAELIELVHLPSGAQIMHIANDDPENLFCLSFQTIPSSSNGVAHILEHTVLCGSKKFPVKDPFFAMQRRSLNTFMNALTGPDFTCYPAASQIPKDFYNLLEVYLDAVFHPVLNELSFLQEGCRLEFSNPTDVNSPLEYRGVVYNEMKGAMTNPNSRLIEVVNQALFPNITYGVNSGGEPADIPKLTYQELWDFHKKYYHPSRCLFFFSGNMPLEGHLDFISKNLLDSVQPVEPFAPLPLQPRYKEPCRKWMEYPIAAEEELYDKTLIAFGWLTCHILNQHDLLALSIIEIILMDTDASPLKMALLKSGLCKQALCHMDDEMSEVPIVIVLKGCNPEAEESLAIVIKNTLASIAKQGFPIEVIENAMHQLEFHRSEINGGHGPFGLSLFLRSALLKQHGGNPERGLKIHSLFDEIRRRNLEDPNYLTNIMAKYLIDNPHAVRVVMVPNKELQAKESENERAVLASIKKNLSTAQKESIVLKSQQLEKFQEKQENADIDILPKVSLNDVPHHVRNFPLIKETYGDLHVFHHNCFTNKIVYADLVFDLPNIAEEDLHILRLFTILFSQMGCLGRNYVDNLEYIQANTGGLGASLTFNLQADDENAFAPSIYIRGKALDRKSNKLFSLIHEMIQGVNFKDVARLKELIMKQYTALQGSLNQNALKYATHIASEGLDVPSKIANSWYGLEYFWKIKEIAQNIDKKIHGLIEKLQEIQLLLFCPQNSDLIISCDAEKYDEIKGNDFYGLKHLQTKPTEKWLGNYPLIKSHSQARVIASPVAFVSTVIKTVPYSHPDSPAINIASFLFDNTTLHPLVREKGGAYGGGTVCNPISAMLYFYSYRDPNIVSTLDAFQTAVNALSNGDFDDVDLEEAKLEMAQALDAPVPPGARGDLAYGWLREGKTEEVRQNFRNKVFALSKEDICLAVKQHIAPKMSSATTAVFAGQELLEKENAKLQSLGLEPFPIHNI